ncbi:MAG: T9SS type A sorting domain-containing protein [Ignavibacteria bacterium]|nr:T9SS type A sorting domain-containing protein [Ignavibacteria bacterium]
MKKCFTALTILLLSFNINSDSFGGWTQLPTGSSAFLTSIFFTDINTGYIGGMNGYLAKTTNGGNSWTVQDPIFASPFVRDISFINSNTGYLCGDDGFIRKTTTGGTTWFPLTTNTSFGIYGIDAVDEFHVYASVTNGSILRSTDGGASFTSVPVSANQMLTVDFSSSDTGYAAGQGGVVYRTTNAGLSWTFLNASTLNNFWDIYALNNNDLYLAAYYGTLRRTDDGGNNFKNAFVNNALLEGIQMLNSMIGYACGLDGVILKTTDGGVTWDQQISNSTESLQALFFPDARTGYMVGSGGTFLKTTDGGDNFSVAVLSPNNSEILTSGSTFPVRWSSVFTGNAKIEYSANNGASWNVIQNSVPAASFEYDWLIPSGSTAQGKIKISSVDNPSVFDVSDGSFYILPSNTFYNVPDLIYYRFNDGINTTPNYAVPGQIFGDADITGMSLQNGGMADSSLVGQGGNGLTNKVSTNWATYFPPTGWTIGFWVSNISLGVNPNNAVFLFTDITANNIRCYYGGALGLTDIDTAIMFRCNGMSNVRIPVVQGQSYYIHLVYEPSPPAVKVYVNGTLTQDIPQSPFLPIGNGPFTIGAYADASSSLANNMRMDEFRVYSRSLGDAEIAATWNTTFPMILTDVQNQTISQPGKFILYDNYPNPFNPSTAIRYSLSEDRFVSLKIYDALGKEVAALVNEKQNAGTYNYQFSTVNYQLSSGIYFYKLEAGDFSETKRMVLLK